CANNLHQIGVAIANYESATGQLPGYSWGYYIAPFMEADSLYSKMYICPSRQAYAGYYGSSDYAGGAQGNSAIYAYLTSDIKDGLSNTMMLGEAGQIAVPPPPSLPNGVTFWSSSSSNSGATPRNVVNDTAQQDGAKPALASYGPVPIYSLYDPSW